jgi:hypothetical protein
MERPHAVRDATVPHAHAPSDPLDQGGLDGLIHMSRNASIEYWLPFYRGHQVPNVEVYKVPVDGDNNQVYPKTDVEFGGPWRWELVLDKRWSYDYSSKEQIEALIPLLADGMAVAAGYACHGSAIRINHHGPNVVPETADAVPGGARTMSEPS